MIDLAEKYSPELSRPYQLTPEIIQSYRTEGFARLKSIFSPELLTEYRRVLTGIVRDKDINSKPLHKRDTYGRAFTQIFNLWRESAMAEALMRSTRLARIAAELMGVSSVRLYHDQALYKEAGGGPTPWHCDQVYWPLDNDHAITAWIPLQAVPEAMGPLAFAPHSHRLRQGRDLPISDKSESLISRLMSDYPVVGHAFDAGEVSFHSGWTFHRAPPNLTAEVRAVFTIIYIDARSRLVSPQSKQRQFDADSWCPGITPGELIDSPINPILYPVD